MPWIVEDFDLKCGCVYTCDYYDNCRVFAGLDKQIFKEIKKRCKAHEKLSKEEFIELLL